MSISGESPASDPKCRSVVIFGHGRSGSKLLQLVLAYVLADQASDLDLYYEPLLWRDYKFSGVNRSAIRIHKSLPLCPGDGCNVTRQQLRFFQTIRHGQAEVTLAKFIRMTGRSRLLHEMFPDARLLFLYRDPVAVLNSIKNWTVTLLGPPHYRSDLSRVIEEGLRQGYLNAERLEEFQRYDFGGELLYWYITHRAALRDLEKRDTPVLSYERLIQDKESVLPWICEYVQKDYKPAYRKLFGIQGYHVRHLDQLLMPKGAPHTRNRSFPQRIREWFGTDRPQPRTFQGVYALDAAPIFSMPTPSREKRCALTKDEEAFVREFCAPVLERLGKLEARYGRSRAGLTNG